MAYKVLIVEDNPDHVALEKRVLESRGCDVLLASDAETGMEIAQANQPDIILLDLGLPDLDGQTLLGCIRRVPHLIDVPVIAVTAWPADEAAQMAAAYGFDGYITKPIQFSTFADKLEAYLPENMA